MKKWIYRLYSETKLRKIIENKVSDGVNIRCDYDGYVLTVNKDCEKYVSSSTDLKECYRDIVIRLDV